MSGQSKFDNAITKTIILNKKPGLKALKKSEGAAKISCAESREILGSVNIDDDCRAQFPQDNRWDYLVGTGLASATAHYVEVHSASSSSVSVMEKKLRWLLDFIETHDELKRIPPKFYWVASGKVKIPRHTPQYRKLNTTLRKRGLLGPFKTLQLET